MKMTLDRHNLTNYPRDGKHMECFIYLEYDSFFKILRCFEIKKGEDGYWYNDKNGKEKTYNVFKSDKTDDRWIVNINKDYASESLKDLFEIKVNKRLDIIIKYCINLYIKSLKMERESINIELESFKNWNGGWE